MSMNIGEAAKASGVFAKSSTPLVSLSSRCTKPASRAGLKSAWPGNRASTALTAVSLSSERSGWEGIPAGLSIAKSAASS